MTDFVSAPPIGKGVVTLKKAHQTFDVLGVPVSVTSLADASDTILQWAADARGRFVCIRDVHGVMRARKDAELLRLHFQADMVTPDGMPLVLLGKVKGHSVERTCGADLMEDVCRRSPARRIKHYFYGGNEGVAERMKAKFEERFPGIEIAGHETPPFRPQTAEEDEATVERIRKSGADVVWVGLSTPKQEQWMRQHVDRVPATLIGVGAAYDFHTGAIRRAPVWMQRNTLEWLHRLISEPRRLWRRYLIMAPKFLVLATLDVLGVSTKRAAPRPQNGR